MKSINIFTAFLIIISCQNTFAQEPDPLSFFPHSVGNIWEYDTPDGIERVVITKDSIDLDSIIYLFYDYPKPFYKIIKNDVYMLSYFNKQTWFDYKLDADSGDYWLVDIRDTSSDLKQLAVVTNEYSANVFGGERILKEISYGLSPDTVYDPNFFWVHSIETLAEGIGLIYKWNEEPPQGPQKILLGCVIDGDTLGTLTSVDGELLMPNEFLLYQNFPNPFNAQTNIKFEIPMQSYVTLKVYDVLGKYVKTLVNEEQPEGRYDVKFDGSNLPSGVYFYELITDRTRLTKKMILLR